MPTQKMKGPVPRRKVFEAILGGIKKSQKDHIKMSGGWVWEGPEYLITTHVAHALRELCGDGTVFLERGSNATLAPIRRRGQPPFSTKGKRYDIALYFRNGNPRSVIEIKNHAQKRAVMKDIDRVIAALKASKLRWGAVGFFYSAASDEKTERKTAEQKCRDHADRICSASKARGRAAKKPTHRFRVEMKTFVSCDSTGDAWLAGCVIIEREQRNPLSL